MPAHYNIVDLIAYYEQRVKQCDHEIFRAQSRLYGEDIIGIKKTEDARAALNLWNSERKIARDTISYLRTIERRGLDKSVEVS